MVFVGKRQCHPRRSCVEGYLSELEIGQWLFLRRRVEVEFPPCPQCRPRPCRLLKPFPNRVPDGAEGGLLPARQCQIQLRRERRFKRSRQKKLSSEDSLGSVAWIRGRHRCVHP